MKLSLRNAYHGILTDATIEKEIRVIFLCENIAVACLESESLMKPLIL